MHVFYGKKRLLYVFSFSLLILSIILAGYSNDPIYLQILDRQYYRLYFEESLKALLPTLCIIYTSMYLIDHDQKAYHMVIPYTSRTYVYLSKFLAYVFIVTISFLFTFLILNGFIYFFTFYDHHLEQILILWIHLYLDSITLIVLFFFFIKKEQVNKSFILILIMLLYPMLIETFEIKYLHYILPVYHSEMKHHWLVYAYKICYICNGILFGLIKNERMKIY